ncbi:Hypothetical predicted protein [Pelobates cultripes]|uniref:Uncharacterized protein n=1 Tax=Pelobates cultripes TaxID=61616 RepID=A0AAD1VRI0_PELCU|nr:Hypothetical predicted protein [Pelobates cultripes]
MVEQSIRTYLITPRDLKSQPEMEALDLSQGLPSTTPVRRSQAPTDTSVAQLTLDGEPWAILPNLLTKADFEALSDHLSWVAQDEIAQVRADMANMEARVTIAVAESRALRTNMDATHTAVIGCEMSIAHLTTWVDDLDNRG